MPARYRLALACLAAVGLAAAQDQQQAVHRGQALSHDQQTLQHIPPHPSSTQPPVPLHRRQDPSSPSTITSVSTSVSVSISVYTSTETSTSTSISTTTATTSDTTRVVPIFYLDERAFEGLPYTLLHRVCGSVVGVDNDGGATTYAITTTRVDLDVPANSTSSSSGSSDTDAPTPSSSSRRRSPTASIITPSGSWASNATGPPSTITQGPTTFVFTGTRFGDPGRTVVNQCRLSGTSSARCNLTHVGPIWYTADPNWNGTYSTYNYTWTSGDRYGFAPCTVTQGVSLLGPPAPTPAASTNGAAPTRAALAGGGSGNGGGGRLASSPISFLVAILLSPGFRNLVWPLIGMIGFMGGLFTLA